MQRLARARFSHANGIAAWGAGASQHNGLVAQQARGLATASVNAQEVGHERVLSHRESGIGGGSWWLPAGRWAASYISISTSSPSTLMGYTATRKAALCPACPVCGSHSQPCQGQTTLSSRITPCPSGPPRCRQTLSMAEIVPFTLATHTTFSPTVNSRASPGSGRSDLAAMRVKGIVRLLAISLQLVACTRNDSLAA